MNAATGKRPGFRPHRMVAPNRRAAVLRNGSDAAFVNTQGGPRRNAKAQIVQVSGEVLPRLYSAGELGSIHSYLYNSGGNIGNAWPSDGLRGETAAAEDGLEIGDRIKILVTKGALLLTAEAS